MSSYFHRLFKSFYSRKPARSVRRPHHRLSVRQLETRELLSATLPTNTVLVESADPVVHGQSLTLTAAVQPRTSNSVLPTGTVTFKIGGTTEHPVPVVNGLATLTVPAPLVGTYNMAADYNGDATFLPSQSTVSKEVVNAAATIPWQQPGVNVTKYGVVGDGKTDDTAALQTLINNSPNGTLFYFPAGTYIVSATINFAKLQTFGIEGAVTAAGTPASAIWDHVANGVSVSADFSPGEGTFEIKNIGFGASAVGGTAFYTVNAQSASFQNCVFCGNMGLNLTSGFNVAVRSSRFNGLGGSDIGLLEWGPTANLVEGCDFSGWTEGIRAAGTGLSIIRSTFEKNHIGMNLGTDPSGGNYNFTRSSLNNLTFTGNDIAINTQVFESSSMYDISIVGNSSAPSGQSQYGMKLNGVYESVLVGVTMSGGYSSYAFYLPGYVAGYATFYACTATNSRGTAWSIGSNFYQPVSVVGPVPSSFTSNVEDITASAVVPGAPGPVLNVTAYGIVGNGSTDDTAAFQALVNKASSGTVFYFPAGIYKISSTIHFTRLSCFGLVGDVASAIGTNAGSTIFGNFAGVLLDVDYGTGAGVFHISDLHLRSSTSTGGVALYAQNAVLSSLQNVQVTGNIGIELVNPYKLSMRSVEFNGSLSAGSDIGLLVSGGDGCTLEQGDFMGWREGVRASGSGLSLYACRFEVNTLALNLGVDPTGNSSVLQGASFAGLSMEENGTFINAGDCADCSFEGIAGQGSATDPAVGQSITGLAVGACTGCVFSGINFFGGWSNAGIVVTSGAYTDTMAACVSTGGLTGASSWSIASGANITFVDCND